MDYADLENRFAFHPANTPTRQAAHAEVRRVCLEAAKALLPLVPNGREQSLVITHLEDAMMWANAGIARSPDPAAP